MTTVPSVGVRSPAIDVEQGRLAGSVRTEDGEPLAQGDVEIDAAQGEQTTERHDDGFAGCSRGGACDSELDGRGRSGIMV